MPATWRLGVDGSTLCSAIHAIKSVLLPLITEPVCTYLAVSSNLSRFKTTDASVSFLESDFRAVNFGAFGRFNVYLFDGPHGLQDQRDGLMLALPALDDSCVFIVDDWNWGQVRQGTMAAIREAGMTVDYMAEIRTTMDGKHAPVSGSRVIGTTGFISVLSKDNSRDDTSHFSFLSPFLPPPPTPDVTPPPPLRYPPPGNQQE